MVYHINDITTDTYKKIRVVLIIFLTISVMMRETTALTALGGGSMRKPSFNGMKTIEGFVSDFDAKGNMGRVLNIRRNKINYYIPVPGRVTFH